MTKCPVCFTQHAPDLYKKVWPLFDKPVYWHFRRSDGALMTCDDCKGEFEHTDVILTQVTCGHRSVICNDCIDKDWLNNFAEYKGKI